MGRAPCCDKANVKKGPWSPEEDAKLKAYIEEHGTGGNWIALPQKIGLKRCGKSCRLRWLNYLRPNIKHGGFSQEEDNIICSLYISIGSRWSIIAAQLPGRTDNDIKNYWNTRLKKKLLGKQRKEQQARRANCFKQEIKIENEGHKIIVPPGAMFINQQLPYWPELPTIMPAMNTPSQDTHFMNQESIKNLLIKLGGRFSDDQQEPNYTFTTNYPLEGSYNSQDQLYGNINSNSHQLINNNDYSVNGGGQTMFQGVDSFWPVELDGLVYGNQQQLEGLEVFYGLDMANVSTGASSSVESSSWGNISPLVYPQFVSEYETCLQSMPQQDSPFEDSSYFGPQL